MHNVAVICEGKTEQIFCEELLNPYFNSLGIYLTAIQLTKPGSKGGDVKYERMLNDLRIYLNQPHWKCVTTFFDFYGLKGVWAGYEEAQKKASHQEKHKSLIESVRNQVKEDLECDSTRYLPNFIMYETEGLYFSSPELMATELGVSAEDIEKILEECKEPEAINNSPQTAPSKRIATLLGEKEFKRKNTDGINVAKRVTLETMRENCPLFNQWLKDIEGMCSGVIHQMV